MKPIQSIPEDQRARYADTAMHGATYHELDESNAALSSSLDETLAAKNMLQRDWLKLHRENQALRSALERIRNFPVHSDPAAQMNYPKEIYADTELVCGEEQKEGHEKYIRADEHEKLLAAINNLVEIVEGVRGSTWGCDGRRLVDTPEWCALYAAR